MLIDKKTLLYCRVSTTDQATGLESQVRALKDYCRLNQIEDYSFLPTKEFPEQKVPGPRWIA